MADIIAMPPGEPEDLDPFDPVRLRMPQNFAETCGVERLLLTVPVRKPSKQDFVRVHPDEDYRMSPVALVELKEYREIYLVTPRMATQLPGEFNLYTLYTTINRQGVAFLWPVRLPDEGRGRELAWHTTAREAAERAMTRWLRIMPNMSLGAYEVTLADGSLPEPEWPPRTFRELLAVAFRDRMIDTVDHPVVKQLRGTV